MATKSNDDADILSALANDKEFASIKDPGERKAILEALGASKETIDDFSGVKEEEIPTILEQIKSAATYLPKAVKSAYNSPIGMAARAVFPHVFDATIGKTIRTVGGAVQSPLTAAEFATGAINKQEALSQLSGDAPSKTIETSGRGLGALARAPFDIQSASKIATGEQPQGIAEQLATQLPANIALGSADLFGMQGMLSNKPYVGQRMPIEDPSGGLSTITSRQPPMATMEDIGLKTADVGKKQADVYSAFKNEDAIGKSNLIEQMPPMNELFPTFDKSGKVIKPVIKPGMSFKAGAATPGPEFSQGRIGPDALQGYEAIKGKVGEYVESAVSDIGDSAAKALAKNGITVGDIGNISSEIITTGKSDLYNRLPIFAQAMVNKIVKNAKVLGEMEVNENGLDMVSQYSLRGAPPHPKTGSLFGRSTPAPDIVQTNNMADAYKPGKDSISIPIGSDPVEASVASEAAGKPVTAAEIVQKRADDSVAEYLGRTTIKGTKAAYERIKPKKGSIVSQFVQDMTYDNSKPFFENLTNMGDNLSRTLGHVGTRLWQDALEGNMMEDQIQEVVTPYLVKASDAIGKVHNLKQREAISNAVKAALQDRQNAATHLAGDKTATTVYENLVNFYDYYKELLSSMGVKVEDNYFTHVPIQTKTAENDIVGAFTRINRSSPLTAKMEPGFMKEREGDAAAAFEDVMRITHRYNNAMSKAISYKTAVENLEKNMTKLHPVYGASGNMSIASKQVQDFMNVLLRNRGNESFIIPGTNVKITEQNVRKFLSRLIASKITANPFVWFSNATQRHLARIYVSDDGLKLASALRSAEGRPVQKMLISKLGKYTRSVLKDPTGEVRTYFDSGADTFRAIEGANWRYAGLSGASDIVVNSPTYKQLIKSGVPAQEAALTALNTEKGLMDNATRNAVNVMFKTQFGGSPANQPKFLKETGILHALIQPFKTFPLGMANLWRDTWNRQYARESMILRSGNVNEGNLVDFTRAVRAWEKSTDDVIAKVSGDYKEAVATGKSVKDIARNLEELYKYKKYVNKRRIVLERAVAKVGNLSGKRQAITLSESFAAAALAQYAYMQFNYGLESVVSDRLSSRMTSDEYSSKYINPFKQGVLGGIGQIASDIVSAPTIPTDVASTAEMATAGLLGPVPGAAVRLAKPLIRGAINEIKKQL